MMSIVWISSIDKDKGMGWYIVKDWSSEKAIYKHGPFDTIEEAKAYAIKKKINYQGKCER